MRPRVGEVIRSFVRALTGLGRSSLAADHSEVGDEIPTVEAFDTQLRRMANHRQDTTTPLVAGSLQLVTLASLKDELGGSWPGFAERWRLIAGEEIQKELGPFDFFTNQDDSTFVVCFADLSVTEARAKAARTSQRIRTRLISEMPHASGRISVDRFVGEIDGGTVLDNGVPPAEALVSSLMKIRREADEASRLQRVASLREVRVLFQPAWDVRRSRSDMNRCLLHPLSGSAAMAQLQALTDKEELVDAVAHLDCLLFAGAMQCLHSALAQRGAKPDLVVPVHFSTLSGAGSSQDEYLVLLEMIPAHYQRYLSLEIHGVPASAEVFELLDVLDRVEPSVRRALLQLSPRDPRVGTHMDSVLWGLSIDLSKWRDSPAILQSWLPSYSRETTSKGLKTVAHGANSLGMAQAARNAGFDYICGSAIHLTSDAPKAPTFLNPLIGWELVSGEGKRRAQRQSSGNRG